MDTTVNIGGLVLKNPITVASGTAGYGEELSQYYDIGRLGAIFTKGLSLKPRPGNPGPRIMETPSGMLNSIGLENVGLERFLGEKLPFLLEHGATVIPNVTGTSIEEYVEMCRILSATSGIAALELNVSCPNVKEGCIVFGRDLKSFVQLLEKVRKAAALPLIVKLSPNVTDISEFANAAAGCGADAVSAVNTYLGMKIDIEKGKPYFINKVAGLSGPAIRPMALRCVFEIFERVNIPVIGIGGIDGITDVIEFIMAGASAVSLGTMNLVNPGSAMKCVQDLEGYMKGRNIENVSTLIGKAHQGQDCGINGLTD